MGAGGATAHGGLFLAPLRRRWSFPSRPPERPDDSDETDRRLPGGSVMRNELPVQTATTNVAEVRRLRISPESHDTLTERGSWMRFWDALMQSLGGVGF